MRRSRIFLGACVWMMMGVGCFGFDRDMLGVHSYALGDAVTAYSGSLDSVYKNPAALSGISQTVFNSSYSSFYDQSYSVASLQVATPVLRRFVVALSVPYRGVDGIPNTKSDTNAQGQQIGVFSDSTTGVIGSIGTYVMPSLFVGMSAGMYHRQVFTDSADSVGFDVGLLYSWRQFKVGVSVQDIGGRKVQWGGSQDSVNQTTSVGIQFGLGNSLFLTDVNWMSGQKLNGNVGGVIHLTQLIDLRAGIRNLSANDWHAGLGMKLKNLGIDYAFSMHSDLGMIHKLGVSYAL